MNAVNLAEKLAPFTEHWQPRTVAQFNGHDIMVVKAKGEFVWHDHADTGELFVAPRGVEHRPVAEEEVHVLIMERAGTPNTGDPATAAERRVV